MTPYMKAAQKLLGKPWNAVEYNCYSFIRELYSEAVGIELPGLFINGASTQCNMGVIKNRRSLNAWEDVSINTVGGIALLGRNKYASHVGIVLEDKYIAHCESATSGVVVIQISQLRSVYGWNVLGAVKYIGGK